MKYSCCINIDELVKSYIKPHILDCRCVKFIPNPYLRVIYRCKILTLEVKKAKKFRF